MAKRNLAYFILPLGLFLVACNPSGSRSDAPIAAPTEAPAQSTSAAESAAVSPALAGGTTFENEASGLSIALPASWRGHYSANEQDGERASARWPKVQQAIEFSYMPQDATTTSESVLVLLTYSATDWANISRVEGPPVGVLVAEAGDRVVVAGMPQSNPYPPGTGDAVQFDSMVMDEADLKAAVKLGQPGAASGGDAEADDEP